MPTKSGVMSLSPLTKCFWCRTPTPAMLEGFMNTYICVAQVAQRPPNIPCLMVVVTDESMRGCLVGEPPANIASPVHKPQYQKLPLTSSEIGRKFPNPPL